MCFKRLRNTCKSVKSQWFLLGPLSSDPPPVLPHCTSLVWVLLRKDAETFYTPDAASLARGGA